MSISLLSSGHTEESKNRFSFTIILKSRNKNRIILYINKIEIFLYKATKKLNQPTTYNRVKIELQSLLCVLCVLVCGEEYSWKINSWFVVSILKGFKYESTQIANVSLVLQSEMWKVQKSN